MIAKNRTNSTWTPLNNEETNNQIFEERRVLINKWFDKWTHEQKKQILEDLIQKSKLKEKGFVRDYVKDHIPALKRDFTRHLPRVISIYIFSFLDPRSLCRCSQVCWYWKYLTELDQLWMPKCMRLGWNLPIMPGQYEVGVWKRNYIENIKTLQIMYPKKHAKVDLSKIHSISKKPQKSAKQPQGTPWRGSDPVPKDTWRFNYLENDDVVQDIQKMHRRKTHAPEGKEITRQSCSKVKTGQNLHNAAVKRSQSYTKLLSSSSDPLQNWEGFKTHVKTPDNAMLDMARPAPVYSAPLFKSAKRQASARTPRDPPSTDLFPKQPWNVTQKDDSDDEP